MKAHRRTPYVTAGAQAWNLIPDGIVAQSSTKPLPACTTATTLQGGGRLV